MLVAKVNNEWVEVKILQSHIPAGKRPLAKTIMVINKDTPNEGKCYLVPATDIKEVSDVEYIAQKSQ